MSVSNSPSSRLGSAASAEIATLRQPDPLQRKLEWVLRACAVLTVLAVLAPLLVVVLSWGSNQVEVWQHLIATQLSLLLRNTLVLVVGVGLGVTLIGVSLAWLTTMLEFPGRRWLEWALMLPMAIPAYVLAFVALGAFDYGGPFQLLLKGWFGDQFQAIDVRSDGLVVAVLVLVLYPYVYMLSRAAFLSQSSDVMEAARMLGCNSWQAFYRVALPMARPAIVAGTSLALMETLADFGTVSVFNYDTFTTAIYKSWFGLFNLQAAAQLASLLLLFVSLALFAEKRARGGGQTVQGGRLQHRFRYRLPKWLAWSATGYCLLILLLAFIGPLLQLLSWTLDVGFESLNQRYIELLYHTLILASSAAVLTLILALLVAYAKRHPAVRWRGFFAIANLGYALPGSVLAVGVVLSFAEIDQWVMIPLQNLLGIESKQLLVGSMLALLAAYWVRFLAVASGPVEAAINRIKPSTWEAALMLGATPWEATRRVVLPMLRPGLMTALILVFVDVMKEMPATLLLRPFGWDTLAVRVYELTSEGQWERAALPALTLVLAGLIPVVMTVRRTTRH